MTKIFNAWKLERKQNEKIKGCISSSSLIPLCTIHLPTFRVCTTFSLLGLQFLRIVWQNIFMIENWKEKKWRNKRTNKQQQPDSGIHNTSSHCPRVYLYSFNLLGLTVPDKCMTKIFRMKWQNDWRIKQIQNSPHFIKTGTFSKRDYNKTEDISRLYRTRFEIITNTICNLLLDCMWTRGISVWLYNKTLALLIYVYTVQGKLFPIKKADFKIFRLFCFLSVSFEIQLNLWLTTLSGTNILCRIWQVVG